MRISVARQLNSRSCDRLARQTARRRRNGPGVRGVREGRARPSGNSSSSPLQGHIRSDIVQFRQLDKSAQLQSPIVYNQGAARVQPAQLQPAMSTKTSSANHLFEGALRAAPHRIPRPLTRPHSRVVRRTCSPPSGARRSPVHQACHPLSAPRPPARRACWRRRR